jgi:hypothetical protein
VARAEVGAVIAVLLCLIGAGSEEATVSARANAERVEIRERGQTRKTDETYLTVVVTVDNSTGRRIQYTGWNRWAGKQLPPRVVDDQGRPYKLIDFRPAKVRDQVSEPAWILPGKSAADLLVFERPPQSVEDFTLDLPGEAVGKAGRISLKIAAPWIADRSLQLGSKVAASLPKPAVKPQPSEPAWGGGYWINDDSQKRHKAGCRYYGAGKGHKGGGGEGVACKVCGG